MRYMTLLLTILAAGIFGQAQQSADPAAGSPQPAARPAAASAAAGNPNPNQQAGGGVIPIELSKSLDAKKLKAGDAVEAKTSTDLHVADGTVIPRGTKVTGQVTEAKAKSKGDAESALGVKFDKVTEKDGKEIPINAIVQAVGQNPMEAVAAADVGGPMGNSAPPSQGGTTSARPGSPGTGTGAPASPSGAPQPGYNPSSPNQGSPAGTQLTPESTGVVGLHNLQLRSDGVLTSEGKDVKLDSGTQIMLHVQNK